MVHPQECSVAPPDFMVTDAGIPQKRGHRPALGIDKAAGRPICPE